MRIVAGIGSCNGKVMDRSGLIVEGVWTGVVLFLRAKGQEWSSNCQGKDRYVCLVAGLLMCSGNCCSFSCQVYDPIPFALSS